MHVTTPARASSDSPKYTLLLVDDTPTNLGVLSDYLAESGLKVVVARDGESALKRVHYAQPDIILLDVMMPGIDGFETCRRLKADPSTSEIPVIFMTALAGVEDKVQGFNAGAVDYVTKPLQQEEVLARVRTHLQIRDLARSLQQKTQEAEASRQLAETRAQELAALNASKDRFFAIIAHDLRSPFTALLGLSMIQAELPDDTPMDRVRDLAGRLHTSARETYNLLQNLLEWSRLQLGGMEHAPALLDVSELVASTSRLLGEVADSKGITLHNELAAGTQVYGDSHMLDTVLRNLISNALKFTPAGGQVTIGGQPAGDQPEAFYELWVRDSGVGMSEEDRSKLFRLDKPHSTRGTAQEQGTGLGLLLCHDLVTKNGGKLWIESVPGQGTTVRFTTPRHPRT
jgi:two-component system sensor histidine kinase/response regulator